MIEGGGTPAGDLTDSLPFGSPNAVAAAGKLLDVEINDLFGLPAHPLLVHIPVVLIPLATIGSIFVAIKPEWRKRYAIPVAVLALVGATAVFLAAKSGESLEERVKEGDLVEEHATAGENAEPFVAVYGVLAVGLAAADLVDRRRRGASAGDPSPATDQGGVATATATATTTSTLTKVLPILAVVTVLSGAVATYFVYEAGHSGAKATWDDVKPAGSGGEGGEEGGLGGLVLPDGLSQPA